LLTADRPYRILFDKFVQFDAKKEKNMKLSARNILKGKVVKVTKGAVNSEVVIELPGGTQLVSIITNTSVENLELKAGKEAYAVIKASNIMVGVD
jgi:molybdopterin-binding protein